MNILVAGCGKIGTTIIDSLVAEGHDVTAIDADAAVLDGITNIYDVIGVCGNGADCETLGEAGVEKAELFVAVTGSDELNMLSCFMAKKMGAAHTIARIRQPRIQRSFARLYAPAAGVVDVHQSGTSGGAGAVQHPEIPVGG